MFIDVTKAGNNASIILKKILPSGLLCAAVAVMVTQPAQAQFDVSTAVYAGASEEFSVASQETNPQGIAFNNAGTKMFIVGNSGVVVEYNLGTAFDVSTAVHAGAGENFSIVAQGITGVDLVFNSDGTKMFIVDATDGAVVEYTLSTAFDVSTAVYAGVSEEFSVASQETNPQGMAFNTGGTKMFIVGTSGDAVVEYNLGTAFDVSTAVYAGASEEFNIAGQETVSRDLAFNNAGTKMYVIGSSDNQVVEYNLSTVFDVSTAAYAGASEEFSVNSQEDFPTDLVFNNDGSKLFVVGLTGDAVVEYTLNSPTTFDVSDAIYSGVSEEFSVVSQETNPQGIAFNTEGSKMFVIGNSGDAVVEYDLSTAFDVSTASYSGASEEFSVASQEASPSGISFNNDGTKMFIIGSLGDAVVEYSLSTAFDVSTATYAGASEEFSVASQESAPQGVAFNTAGTKMFIIGNTNDRVVEYNLGTAFDVSTAVHAGASEEFSIAGQETSPRDLAFNNAGTKMYIIGATDDAIVEYNLGTAFDVSTAVYAGASDEVSITNQETIPTDLVFNSDGTKMFILGSGDDAVVEYTLQSVAPTTSDNNVIRAQDTEFAFSDADFVFSDLNINDTLSAIDITTLPTSGTLYLDANDNDTNDSENISAGDDISRADLQAGNLRYIPASGVNGFEVTSFTFAVSDGSSFSTSSVMSITLIAPTAFDVSTAIYTGISEEFTISVQNASRGITFNNDGTKMFVTGNGRAVFEYTLGTPFNVSTAVYAGASEAFNVANEELAPNDVVFNTTGTKMFILGDNDDAIVEYNLSTAFDVSTATYAGAGEEFSVAGQETRPEDMAFNTDGTKMFILGNSDDRVTEYSLSTAFDVSTAVHAGASEEFVVGTRELVPRGMAFNIPGTKMFIIGQNDNAVVEYNLSTAFDVSTASYAGGAEEFSFASEEPFAFDITFSNDGARMFIFGSNGEIAEYKLVNAAPSTSNSDVFAVQDIEFAFGNTHFPFSDPDISDAISAIDITTLPASGTLYLDANNNDTNDSEEVSAGDDISLTDLQAGNLRYIPVSGSNGFQETSFTFAVSDATSFSASSTLSITLDATSTSVAGTSGVSAWHLFANPFTTNMSDLLSSIFTQGIATGADATSGVSNVYTFSESTQTFNAPTNLNTSLNAGVGLAVFTFADDDPSTAGIQGDWPKTLSVSGTTTHGSPVNVAVSNTDLDGGGTLTNDEGWNLVGNPFGTAIDVDDVITALQAVDANANTSVYIWDKTQNAGAGAYVALATGAENRIAAFQSFFVRLQTPAASGNASFTNAFRTSGATTLLKSRQNQDISLGLELTHEGFTSKPSVVFSDKGQDGIDPDDVYHLASLSSQFVELYSKVGDQNLLVNHLPLDAGEIEIPLYLRSSQSGTFTLNWDSKSLPKGWQASLLDTQTGTLIALDSLDRSYSFEHTVQAKKVNPPVLSAQTSIASKAKQSNQARFRLVITQGTAVSTEEPNTLPTEVTLEQNFPNPFNPTTNIRFTLPEAGDVRLQVFDLLGREVSTLINSRQSAGRYTVQFNASRLASGVYIYRLQAGGTVLTRKLTLIK